MSFPEQAVGVFLRALRDRTYITTWRKNICGFWYEGTPEGVSCLRKLLQPVSRAIPLETARCVLMDVFKLLQKKLEEPCARRDPVTQQFYEENFVKLIQCMQQVPNHRYSKSYDY